MAFCRAMYPPLTNGINGWRPNQSAATLAKCMSMVMFELLDLVIQLCHVFLLTHISPKIHLVHWSRQGSAQAYLS